MDGKFNFKFLLLFLSTCLLFMYIGHFSTKVGLFLITFILIFYKNEKIDHYENFENSDSNNLWDVRFQEKVMFYNSPCMLKSNFGNQIVGTNCSVSDLNNLPVWFSWENFVIEDARLAYGTFRGNINLVPYNSPIYLQGQSRNNINQTYISVNSNKLNVTEARDINCQFILEPIDNTKSNTYVKFGDKVYLKHLQTNQYISIQNYSDNSIKLSNLKDKFSQWNIYNQMGYGHDRDVDWAREALATMSSIYANKKYLPSNCTDGDRNTFCHSDIELDTVEPYLDIHLTRLINVKKVNILNRQDCCKDRLGKFWIKIYFDKIDPNTGKLESTIVYKSENTVSSTQDLFTLENISAVGNRVRVQLSNTGAKRILNLASVSVFGDPVFNTVGVNSQVAENTSYILYKPLQITEKMAVPVNLNCLDSNCNFAIHFAVNLSDTFNGGGILDIGKLKIRINKNGKVVINYYLENDSSSMKTLTGKTEIAKSRFNYITIFVYSGINQENGWVKIKVKSTNKYFIINELEKRYLSTSSNSSNLNEFTEIDSVPLEQYMYLGHVKSDFENVPFMRLFVNKKLDSNISFTQSNKIIIGEPKMQLYALKGYLGPLKITNYFYTNEQIVKLISFEENINLGNFDITDNKRVAGIKLPNFGKMGYSLAFWLFIDSENLQNGVYCILNKKNNLVILYDSIKYVLEFVFTNNKNKTVVYNVPFSHNIVPFQYNHFAITIDNVKQTCKIYLNMSQVASKKLSNTLLMDNIEPILIGNCNNSNNLPMVGKMNQLNISNYVYGKKFIDKLYMENQEFSKAVDKINNLFHSVGCPADILSLEKPNVELQQLYLATMNRDPNALSRQFKKMKDYADDFIDNPDNNPEKLKMLEMCYGVTTKKVLNRILKMSMELNEVKNRGEVKLLLIDGIIDTKSSTVIGPKMIKTYKLDNIKFDFNLIINSLPENTMCNLLAFKFIQGKKHALVPQMYFDGNLLVLDIYTTEGIETITINTIMNYNEWYNFSVVFQKGTEFNLFINQQLVHTQTTIGSILISNVFEAILGGYMDMPGFDGRMSDLQISYNTLYSNLDNTKLLLSDTYSLNVPKKIKETIVTKNNENSTSFTIHFWIFFRSQSNISNCNILQGVYKKTYFKLYIGQDSNQNLILTVGQSSNHTIRLPNYFFNQWNYLTIEFDQNVNAGKYTFCKIYINDNVIYSVETSNLVDTDCNSRESDEANVVLLLGECKNSFVKDLRVSNYLLEKTQIYEFMSDKVKKNKNVDAKKPSLFDLEKEMNQIKKDLFNKKNDPNLQEKCFVMENNWNNFKSKNEHRLNKA